MTTENLYYHEHRVPREEKEKRNQHKSRGINMNQHESREINRNQEESTEIKRNQKKIKRI